MTGRAIAARAAYGLLFVVVLPLSLVVWARAAAPFISLPPVHGPRWGLALALVGLALWAAAVRELATPRGGGGLPMNAFPPPRLATGGPYRVLAHPVYAGAGLISLGVSIAAGSAAGLWLVSPALILGMMALVVGYERLDLRRRFGAHSSLAGRAIAATLGRPMRLVWRPLRGASEALANSWREWRFGPLRVINHGLYAGVAGALCFWITAVIAADQPLAAVVIATLAGLIGAGVWAQWLESSSGLLRPFGYYGGVFGAAVGIGLARAVGADPRVLLGAMAVAAPWVQAVGRMRCLVQGCCHGAPAPEWLGIRYRHPRSRVAYLAHLAGRPLHPTPLYSIISNVVLGTLLVVLCLDGARVSMLAGVYLLGNGLSRFAEEGYRGEPQTAVVGGLRLYQWLAVGAAVVGAWLTTRAWPPAPVIAASALLPPLGGAIAFGALCAVAMGVDLPESNRRFSRLAD